MNSKIRIKMLGYGVETRCRVSESDVDWWISQFGSSTDRFPAGLCRQLSTGTDYEHDFGLEKIDTLSNEASVSLKAHFDNALVYEAGRSVMFPDAQINMDFLKVEEDFRRQGISRSLLRNAYRLARELNLERLGITAVDDGSFLWARAGFLPSEKSWKDPKCRDLILMTIGKVRELNWEDKQTWHNIIMDDNPAGIWMIADSQRIVTSTTDESVRKPLGEVLLIESKASWRGRLEFSRDDDETDGPHLERLRNYLGFRL